MPDSDILMVHAPADYLICGGEGIDFLLVEHGVDLFTKQEGTTRLADIEVLIRPVSVEHSVASLGLSTTASLQQQNIFLSDDGRTLSLGAGWHTSKKGFTNGVVDLELASGCFLQPLSEKLVFHLKNISTASTAMLNFNVGDKSNGEGNESVQ